MKRFSNFICTLAAVAAAAQAAPEIPEIVPKQVPRSSAPLVIEDHRFSIDVHKKIKAQDRLRLRWSVLDKPAGAAVVCLPTASLLDGEATTRDIVGFEVDRAGSYTIGIEAADDTGTSRAQVVVDVKNPLRLLTRALPPAAEGHPYEMRFFAQGGTPPYRFDLQGTLPAGLVFTDGAITGTPTAAAASPAELQLTVTDAAGSSQSATLALAVPREPVPWGMLNIGSSFTPHDDPLRAAAKHLGWDAQGWRLDRGGTLGVGVGYTWNNDFTQRWRMLDAIRSGQFASLFLHQGTPWSNTQWGRVADERGELTDLGALHAFLNAAREVMPRHEWPVAFNAYWHWEIPGGRERDVKREYLTNGSEADATALYYEGALRQALEASRLAGQPVYLIPIGPVMHAVRRSRQRRTAALAQEPLGPVFR